jgi:hypothetical protein
MGRATPESKRPAIPQATCRAEVRCISDAQAALFDNRVKKRPAAMENGPMASLDFKHAAMMAIACAALGACQKKDHGPIAPTDTKPPLAAQDTTVPGGETTEVPARTGSQSSGALGSSVVIGAPKKGETGAAFAHGGA